MQDLITIQIFYAFEKIRQSNTGIALNRSGKHSLEDPKIDSEKVYKVLSQQELVKF